nr:hypothetical protein [Succinivibrionaceae bacterium]
MPSIHGTETELNVMASFAAECQRAERMGYCADEARLEGAEDVAVIFERLRGLARVHAERLYRFLEGGTKEVTATYAYPLPGDPLANLQSASQELQAVAASAYGEQAATAVQEGLTLIAAVLEGFQGAYERQAELLLDELEQISDGGRYRLAEGEVGLWQCRACGCTVEGATAPEACPACARTQRF